MAAAAIAAAFPRRTHPATPGTSAATASVNAGAGQSSQPNALAALPEDFVLNNTWILGKVLGTGSYATVRMARHITTGQLAVCKTTTVKASDNTKDMEIQRIRLQREVACLLHLDGHPNIVRIYDVVADLPNDTVHIVMEHVEGEELYEFLKKCPDRRADEDTVRNITRQVLNSFVYMHEKKTVLHRDIKLDNIMLTKDGQVKLIDFNLSTMFSTDPSRKLTESVGCIHYASPQILEAAHRIPYSASNGWSDVWSFGVVVFALLQGVFPFKELTPTKLHAEIQKRGGKNLTFPVPLSWEAKAFITDVLDPYRRWSARELLNHPFVVGVRGNIWDSDQSSSSVATSSAQAGLATPLAPPVAAMVGTPGAPAMPRTRTDSNGSNPEFVVTPPGGGAPQPPVPQPPRSRFQMPMPGGAPGTPIHPSLAMLKEQLPAPRTPNAAMDISQMVAQNNYFAIQPLPSPSISQGAQSQLQYFDQPRTAQLQMPNIGTPGPYYNGTASAFNPALASPAAPALPSPAAPPFRGLQWNAHTRTRAESVQYTAPLETPALRPDNENPEAMAVDVLLNLDPGSHQMVPTPPATPSNMIDYLSPSPPEQPAAPQVPQGMMVPNGGQMHLPTPSTPGVGGVAPTPGRSPGPQPAETPGGSGWKGQLAILNQYSRILMRDAAAKLASVAGTPQQQQSADVQMQSEEGDNDSAGSMTRLQKAAWKMGVHNLIN